MFLHTVSPIYMFINRGRIVDEADFSTKFYINTRPSMSDAEEV